MFLTIFNNFIFSLGAYNHSLSVAYSCYPFPYPDKAITFDIDNIGSDIAKIIYNFQP